MTLEDETTPTLTGEDVFGPFPLSPGNRSVARESFDWFTAQHQRMGGANTPELGGELGCESFGSVRMGQQKWSLPLLDAPQLDVATLMTEAVATILGCDEKEVPPPGENASDPPYSPKGKTHHEKGAGGNPEDTTSPRPLAVENIFTGLAPSWHESVVVAEGPQGNPTETQPDTDEASLASSVGEGCVAAYELQGDNVHELDAISCSLEPLQRFSEPPTDQIWMVPPPPPPPTYKDSSIYPVPLPLVAPGDYNPDVIPVESPRLDKGEQHFGYDQGRNQPPESSCFSPITTATGMQERNETQFGTKAALGTVGGCAATHQPQWSNAHSLGTTSCSPQALQWQPQPPATHQFLWIPQMAPPPIFPVPAQCQLLNLPRQQFDHQGSAVGQTETMLPPEGISPTGPAVTLLTTGGVQQRLKQNDAGSLDYDKPQQHFDHQESVVDRTKTTLPPKGICPTGPVATNLATAGAQEQSTQNGPCSLDNNEQDGPNNELYEKQKMLWHQCLAAEAKSCGLPAGGDNVHPTTVPNHPVPRSPTTPPSSPPSPPDPPTVTAKKKKRARSNSKRCNAKKKKTTKGSGTRQQNRRYYVKIIKSPHRSRPLSAYNYFFQQERARLITLAARDGNSGDSSDPDTMASADTTTTTTTSDSLPDALVTGPISKQVRKERKKNPHKKIGFGNLARQVASRWKALTAEERLPYEQQARQDRERYEAEKEMQAKLIAEQKQQQQKQQGLPKALEQLKQPEREQQAKTTNGSRVTAAGPENRTS